ncbi:MAG: ABC transporter permease, partial [Cyclobacteriaceae bacterium]|nr:ABC transporter permease [Cyclobacteriaceae bacterium]
MLKNYLIIAYRNLLKNKVFVFINIVGLGVAIASSIVAYLNYDFNEGFDVEHINAPEIYRVNSSREFNGRTTTYGLAPKGMGEMIRQNIPELTSVVRITPGGGNIRIDEDLFSSNITYVDEEFFNMFTFDITGSIDLKNKSNIYISDKIANKYFGSDDPIGKIITHVLPDRVKDYTVAGVFIKKPGNSSFADVETITNYENFFEVNPDTKINEWNSWNLTFIQSANPNIKDVMAGEMVKMIEPQNLAREDYQITNYYLDPLPGMAKRTESDDIGVFLLRQGIPGPAVSVPLIMSGLLLLLACFNFTNSSIAISGKRLKEIGLRKVMGGLRSQLVFQFLTENILLCFMALLVGLVLAEFLVPVYSEMWPFLDLSLSYSENSGLIIFLIGILFLTGFIAGSYPAFYISKFEPTSILKRTEKYGGAGILSKVLLVFQFTISLLAVIFSVSFIQNANYQQNFDLGYTSDGVVHVQFNTRNEYDVFRNKVEQN